MRSTYAFSALAKLLVFIAVNKKRVLVSSTITMSGRYKLHWVKPGCYFAKWNKGDIHTSLGPPFLYRVLGLSNEPTFSILFFPRFPFFPTFWRLSCSFLHLLLPFSLNRFSFWPLLYPAKISATAVKYRRIYLMNLKRNSSLKWRKASRVQIWNILFKIARY